MKFIRCIVFDLREGFASVWPLFVVVIVFQIANAASLRFLLASFDGNMGVSLGDYVLFAYSGIREYSPEEYMRFNFPVAWAFLLLLGFYIPLAFPFRDMKSLGRSILVATGSRWIWWLSKCCWVALCSVLVTVASYGTLVGVTLLFDGDLVLQLHEYAIWASRVDLNLLLPGPWSIGLFAVSSSLVCAALCLCQLALSLLLRPTIAYLATVASLFVSIFVSSPSLPGEYLMAARSVVLVEQGARCWDGVVYALAMAAVAMTCGFVLFSRLDIADREMAE